MEQTQAVNKSNSWRLFVGLGNPGKKYENTYHNLGEMAVREMIGEESGFTKPFSVFKNKPFQYFKKNDRIFIRPTTFMNESGAAVISAMRHFGIKNDELVVLHDDTDLDLGEYKIELGRGSAGHNGVASIIETIGTKDFWRIRIGARGQKKGKAGDFILDKITSEDMKTVREVLAKIKTLCLE